MKIINVIYIVMLIIICDISCKRNESVIKVYTTSFMTNEKKWIIQWGIDNHDELLFVAIEGDDINKSGNLHGLITAVSTSDKSDYAIIKTPKGNMKIPNKYRMFESINGVYRQTEKIVTLNELNAFFDSNPNNYGIDAILGVDNRGKRRDIRG